MPAWFGEDTFSEGTLRTAKVYEQGVDAVGSPVRVLINDTSDVVSDNPYLPPIVYLGSLGSSGYHATAVAGNVANVLPGVGAAAAGLPQLYSHAGTGDVNAPVIWNTAIAQGIDFGNCSWWNLLKGQIEFLDRYFDYTVRNFGVLMFKSNGNQGYSSEPYGTTPGQGYNMLSTAHYSDADTLDWSDDVMSDGSSWWNPIEGHEKPELAAPGQGTDTTSTSAPWQFLNFGGSSAASPLTLSVAVLLATAEPVLLSEPTSVKAVLMASAWHNVEGEAVLSDRDGAGSLHAAAAYATVRDQQWWFQDVVDADFQAGVLDVPMPLLAGDETRVCALWFSNPDSAYTTDVLDMDLDLAVLAPSGAVLASSASTVNPFELAAFVPPTTGTYTVRLTRQRFEGTSEPLTVAWTSRSDTAQASLVLSPTPPAFAVGQTPVLELREPFEGGSKAYALTASLSPPNGVALFNGFTLPTALDPVTLAVLQWPWSLSQLSPVGGASLPIPIPPMPGLAGITLHFGAVVFSGSNHEWADVAQVSDTLTLTIAP
jgi:hypothetical protein